MYSRAMWSSSNGGLTRRRLNIRRKADLFIVGGLELTSLPPLHGSRDCINDFYWGGVLSEEVAVLHHGYWQLSEYQKSHLIRESPDTAMYKMQE